MFKIATWNVNSIKVRLDQVLAWLEDTQVDVLALQEIKCTDDNFPSDAFTDLGYNVTVSGQKTYNGVAILSRQPQSDTLTDIPKLDDPQRRILVSTVNNYRVVNLYVPNGSEVGSDKYAYKLDWLAKVSHFLKQELKQVDNLIVLGDFNIAPEDIDVYDPEKWVGSVLVSEPEREAFQGLLAHGLVDSLRLFDQGASYSWWDYRRFAFKRNAGLRIDHILVSQAMVPQCQSCRVDIEPRKQERPSDHAPVILTIGQ